ncbi:MAG: hypothetical protein HQL69_20515 [Magnetococcales bacterium]|nr:hypothetical protein [Magnetococcales bacterium]
MQTIDQLCDKAIKNHNLRSDRALGRILGVSQSSISQWRTKRAWPSDERMIHLANLAGEKPEQALLLLSIWRTEGETRATWQKLFSTLSAACLAIAIALPAHYIDGKNALLSIISVTWDILC